MTFRPTLPRASHRLPPSSRAWLARQFRDPYVKARLSHPATYRSRSAFKLIELDSKWGFLSYKDVRTVIDLGAAPGGWSQVVAGKLGWADWDLPRVHSRDTTPSRYGMKNETKNETKGKDRVKNVEWSASDGQTDEVDFFDLLQEDTAPSQSPVGRGTVIAVDLLRMEPIRGVKALEMDFLSSTAESYISALLDCEPDADGKADVILSDMAANFTGNTTVDIQASLRICESVFQFAQRHLRTAENLGRRRGGALVLKHFASPGTDHFRKKVLVPNFNTVTFEKPPSSRSESGEGYWVCLGWKGGPTSTMPSPS